MHCSKLIKLYILCINLKYKILQCLKYYWRVWRTGRTSKDWSQVHQIKPVNTKQEKRVFWNNCIWCSNQWSGFFIWRPSCRWGRCGFLCSKYQFNVFDFDIFSHSYSKMYLCAALVMGMFSVYPPGGISKKKQGMKIKIKRIHKNSNLPLYCKCKQYYEKVLPQILALESQS